MYIYISFCVLSPQARAPITARTLTGGVQFYSCCLAATQLARQLHQERTQVVCSNRESRKRPARRHSRDGP